MGPSLTTEERTRGLILGICAYGAWGLMPLYFSMVRDVPPIEMLFQRVIWSFLFLIVLLIALGKFSSFASLWMKPRLVAVLALTAFLISCNWLLYIISASTRQIQQASVGYYLSPLLSVLLGRMVLLEPMRTSQWVSFFMALSGAMLLTMSIGRLPVLALGLAATFSLYGLFRKMAPVDAVIGLAAETAILFPIGLGGILTLGGGGFISGIETGLSAWVAASGVITIVPLLLFIASSRRIPLVLIGFFQYLSPTIQFLLAVFVLREDWDHSRFHGYLLIWAGLILFSIDALVESTRKVPS